MLKEVKAGDEHKVKGEIYVVGTEGEWKIEME